MWIFFFLSWNTECLIFMFMFSLSLLSHRETNLKVKQALTVTGDMGDSLEALAAFNGEEKEREREFLALVKGIVHQKLKFWPHLPSLELFQTYKSFCWAQKKITECW